MNKIRACRALLCLSLGLVVPGLAGMPGVAEAKDYSGPALSDEERQKALDIFTASAESIATGLRPFEAESKVIPDRRYLVDVLPRIGGGAYEGHRLAFLRHVYYRENGIYLLLRTIVSLKTGTFVEVRIRTHEPVPLAAAELARAKEIVLAKHPNAAARFPEGVEYAAEIQLPLVTRKSEKTYGHRLVAVRMGARDADKGPHRALVDLSLGDDSEGVVTYYTTD